MKHSKWFNLQLFADGGEGGEGAAATGASPADAGQDYESRLRAKGVPEGMIKSRAKKAAPVAKEQPKQQDAAAENTVSHETLHETTWDEFFSKSENKDKMEEMMKERVKKYREAADSYEKAKNFHSIMAKKYNLDPENIDFEQLTEKALSDDSNFEEAALAEGKPVEEVRQRAANDIKQQMAQAHVAKVTKQAEELKALYPDFDLNEWLSNPQFKKLIHPGVGLSVRQAYEVMNSEAVQARQAQAVAQATMQKAANAIMSGSHRPPENGTGAKAASVTSINPRNMSRRERQEFIARVERDWANGKKTYPGGYTP